MINSSVFSIHNVLNKIQDKLLHTPITFGNIFVYLKTKLQMIYIYYMRYKFDSYLI